VANARVLDLADCTEFRQTLEARPPRCVHGTVVLLAALLGAALLWAALTKVDLVVRAGGRVRPASATRKVSLPAREGSAATVGCRVLAVTAREGDEVRQGDELVRLDTERLDVEVARRKRTIQAGAEELTKLVRLEELSVKQFEVARARAQAELDQALAEVEREKARQASDVRQARGELEDATRKERVLRRLAEDRAVARAELDEAAARLHEAREKLQKARLPVDEGRVAILRQALAQVGQEDAVKREELTLRRGLKQAEVEAARVELANLEAERTQAVLRAPVDGVVTAGDVKAGDFLEPGKVVLEIAERKGFRFEVSVPSEEMAHVRVGMPVRVKLDAYDYQKYGTLTGTVCFISPDSGVAEGQRTATYVVKVQVNGDEVGRGEQRGRVKLGLTGQAEIVTGHERLLALLLKKIRQSISLG
jgi:multidrug resistance efflux pump